MSEKKDEFPTESRDFVSMYQRERIEESEKLIEEIVEKVIAKLQIPTRSEFDALSKKVDALLSKPNT